MEKMVKEDLRVTHMEIKTSLKIRFAVVSLKIFIYRNGVADGYTKSKKCKDGFLSFHAKQTYL